MVLPTFARGGTHTADASPRSPSFPSRPSGLNNRFIFILLVLVTVVWGLWVGGLRGGGGISTNHHHHQTSLLAAPSFPFGTVPPLPASDICPAHVADAHARLLLSKVIGTGHFTFTACAAAGWLESIRDLDATKPSPPPRTLINVGANKGYVVAQFLAAFAPHLGHTPQTLYAYLASRPDIVQVHRTNKRWACGSCQDCMDTIDPGPEARPGGKETDPGACH
jgi:hypothetical protein